MTSYYVCFDGNDSNNRQSWVNRALNLMLPNGSSQQVPLKAGSYAAQDIGSTEGHAVVIEQRAG